MSEPEVLQEYAELPDTAGVVRSYRAGAWVQKSTVVTERDAWEPASPPPPPAPKKKAPAKKKAAAKKK